MKLSMVIVYVIAIAIVVGGEIRIKGKVRKRFNSHRRHRAALPPCSFNESIIEDEWSLMEAIGKSKYIFTAKVLNVKKFKLYDDGIKSNLYRVNLRRVLKGSLSDLRVKEGTGESQSGWTLAVEKIRVLDSCAPGPRPRLSAIFLCSGVRADSQRGPSPRLQLLTDPVPLTLYHLDRINAAVKAKSTFENGSKHLLQPGGLCSTKRHKIDRPVPPSFHIRGVVKKRDTFHRKKNTNGPKCVSNETITNDYEILSSAVSESKYVFTARVLSVKKIKRGRKPHAKVFMSYKLYIRLVMKGDVAELRSHVFSGDERSLNGAIVFVDWLRTNKCAYKLYRHSSGIFLSDGFYGDFNGGNAPRMRLLNEPLPLSLYDLDRVNAALKGKCLQL
ncbi:unnamed protein product [Diatraea saccharalis]|uniref:Uncharacterized protein n=1 Tax=Diatraea saccharalis TaxID=40085 RepID=A0A9N9WII0_9NEOP|nr:unnamed protein product [Diatraea saccharalis]